MPSPHSHVRAAIDRWRAKGLLDQATAARLRAEAEEAARTGEHRRSQLVVGATGAALLLIAGGVFLSWVWPSVGSGGQAILLATVAAMGFWMGRMMENRDRWMPAAHTLQMAGVALLLLAVEHSEGAWPRSSPEAIVAGVIGACAGAAALIYSYRRPSGTPVVEVILCYLGAFLLLARATPLSLGAALWVVDGVSVAALAWLILALRPGSAATRRAWVRTAILSILFCGFVLAYATATEVLGTTPEDAVVLLDPWLFVAMLVAAWAARETELKTASEHRLASYFILSAVALAFWTLAGAMEVGSLLTALGVAAVGVAGLGYALPRQARRPTVASCLAVVAAAWYYGATQAGAPGVVAALAFSAVVFFVLSARLGKTGEDESEID